MDAAARAEVVAGWEREVSGTAVHADRLVHVEFIWGTAITLELHGTAGRTGRALAAVARCRAWFVEVDERFSPFRVLSEVSAARTGRAGPGPASPDFIAVQSACEQARQLTGRSAGSTRLPTS